MSGQIRTIAITGGAGFVGSSLALNFKKAHPDFRIICLDNLKRRGSELNLARFKKEGVEFVHADIRNPGDLMLRDIDLVIDCAAEPSVLAGVDGAPDYLLHTNLLGTLNCLELARRNNAAFLFISTSRVYPYDLLNSTNIVETESRFDYSPKQKVPGLSQEGVAETLPLSGAHTLYGATKLASEIFVNEYAATYNLKVVINRCGNIAGPWQMGKTDQGILALWVSKHFFKRPAKYIGFGGSGKQVRDFIHVDDLFDLVDLQISDLDSVSGKLFNVGGGKSNSVSLRELTAICQEVTGNKIEITGDPIDRPGDLKCFIMDARQLTQELNWSPKRTVRDIVTDTVRWIDEYQNELVNILD